MASIRSASSGTTGLHPEACRRIQAAAQNALQGNLWAAAPRFGRPVELEVNMLRPSMTERSLNIPGVKLRRRSLWDSRRPAMWVPTS